MSGMVQGKQLESLSKPRAVYRLIRICYIGASLQENIMAKQLYKSTTDKKFAGVSAGLADYFDIDVTLMRLLVLCIILFSGLFPGLMAYIIAAIIMPEAPSANLKKGNASGKK